MLIEPPLEGQRGEILGRGSPEPPVEGADEVAVELVGRGFVVPFGVSEEFSPDLPDGQGGLLFGREGLPSDRSHSR